MLAPNFEGLAHRGPTRGVVIVVEIPPSLPNEPRWRHRKETRPTREDAKEILIVAEILLRWFLNLNRIGEMLLQRKDLGNNENIVPIILWLREICWIFRFLFTG